MRTFADFSNQLLTLKETLKKEEIANVVDDECCVNATYGKKVKKEKSKTFNVSPALFDMFRRGKKRNLRSGQNILIWKMRVTEFYIHGQ